MIVIANIGAPMIFIHLPMLVVILAPIILVETLIAVRRIGLGWKRTLAGVSLANAVSTFVGVPLAWGVMVLFELVTAGGGALGLESPLQKIASVTLQAAWLIPYEDEFYWMIPAATAVLLVPYFLASFYIERFACLRLWHDAPRGKVTSTVLMANAVTYGMMFLGAVIWLLAGIASGPIKTAA